jgi:hypothetical protein
MLAFGEEQGWVSSCTPPHSQAVGYDYVGNKGHIYIHFGADAKRDVEGRVMMNSFTGELDW